MDGDGLQDPFEYALMGVRVFADLDGDGILGNEPSTKTNGYGSYNLNNLPAGEYDVLVEVPSGYKAALRGSDRTTVTITEGSGVGGTTMALTRTGFDLELAFSSFDMSNHFITGTTVKVPVILTNNGNKTMQAGDLSLRVSLSEDSQASKDDVLLMTAPLRQKLEPGKSAKIELNVSLPGALFHFKSYLIVEALGKALLADIGLADNQVVSAEPLYFHRAYQQTTLSSSQYSNVSSNWNQTVPYGGYVPGYGLGGGYSSGGGGLITAGGNGQSSEHTYTSPEGSPTIGSVCIEGDHLIQGRPTRITAEDVNAVDGRTIERVLFFYDKDGDGKADDLLGIDNDGADGYSILADVKSIQSLGGDNGQVYAVAEDDQGYMGGNVTDASVCLGVDISAGKSIVFKARNGAVVTVSMAGKGRARVLLGGEGVQAYDLGRVIEINGNAELGDIRLYGTTGRSKLMIDVSGNKKAVMTGKITGNRPLGELLAEGVNLRGGIQMTGRGTIQSIKALALQGGVVMPGEQLKDGVTISVKKLKHSVELGSPVALLNADNMINVRLSVPYAERILVQRNYTRGSLTFTDTDATLSLNVLEVGNAMSRVQVRAEASINTIRVKSMIESDVRVGGSDWLSGPASSASQSVRRGMIKTLSVDGGVFADSFVSAWRIGKVNLDEVSRDTVNEYFGLAYHRLGRYVGPENAGLTVI